MLSGRKRGQYGYDPHIREGAGRRARYRECPSEHAEKHDDPVVHLPERKHELYDLQRRDYGREVRKYLKNDLIPTLVKEDIVVMDNLRAHHVKEVRETFEEAGIHYS